MKLKNYFKQILYIIGNKTKTFSVLITLFLLISFFETLSLAIIVPYLSILLIENKEEQIDSIFYEVINKFQLHENIILSFGLIIILIFSCKLLISILNIFIINTIAWKEIVRIRVRLLFSFYSMNYEDYIKKNSSEYINQIALLSSIFVKNTFFPLIKMLSDFSIMVCITIFLGFLNIYVLITVLTILLIFLFTYDIFFRQKVKKYGFEMDQAQRNILKNINEMFYGFKEIKVLNKFNFFINKIILSSRKMAIRSVNIRLIADSPRFIYEFMIAILIISFVIYYSSNLQKNIILIIPTIAVFILAFLRILPMVSTMNASLTNLRSAIVATETLYKQLRLTENLNTIKNKEYAENELSFKSLKFDNVSFGYDKKNIILNSINFELKSGEMIGIVGGSGSGKTTFVDLLLGLLKPDEGTIYLNDKIIDFSDGHNEMADISAYLPQVNFIFEDSITNNVSLTEDTDADDQEKIKRILRKVNLPFDINKKLSDRGSNLSGGQKQKISMARSFFSNRQILVMDESTNALDQKNELEILDYLNSIKKEITIILISHNYDTLKYCDKIYKIENKTLKKI